MPTRAPKPCATPGCPNPTYRTRCPHHEAAYQQGIDRRRPTARQRGYDTRWQTTRRRYLLAHSWCSVPGCDQPATDVHHIDGLGPAGPRGHDPENLRALCHPHHSQTTARDQPGGWNRR